VGSFRNLVRTVLPGPLYSALRKSWQRALTLKRALYEWTPFLAWLVFQCLRHRKKAVIVCRCGALGDVICTLPLGHEIRQKHPRQLIIFLTASIYRDVVLLSRSADLVYGSKVWAWPFIVPSNFNVLGLVEKVYNPQTTDERLEKTGATCHLVDDLAASCGITLTARQPRLYPSSDLINQTRLAFGLSEDAVGNRLIIGINGGRSWPIREWDPEKWQRLINKIHSACNALIIQFGVTKNDGADEYGRFTGVQSLVNRLNSEEMVALAAICDLIISIDSGPIHLAGAVGTAVVGIFGPVNPLFRLPIDSPSIGLAGDVPCLYCHHKTPLGHWHTGCPNDIRCMKQLDDETVFEAVKSILSQKRKLDIAIG
jgi:ADP-heptose:LPS heptosyltransferase